MEQGLLRFLNDVYIYRVYGRMPLKKIGAFAEYAAVDQNAIAKGPAYLSDEEASSVPLTALTALQAPIC